MFLSYGDMDVFLLQLIFWNVPKIDPTVEISTTKDLKNIIWKNVYAYFSIWNNIKSKVHKFDLNAL